MYVSSISTSLMSNSFQTKFSSKIATFMDVGNISSSLVIRLHATIAPNYFDKDHLSARL